ncbi:MAG: helix-turn-helix domain-containing protein [Lachnospiraceae bacterium]|nr:helix-turn-helix domain-containing protein [Lachnospiraceae bacterium]
MYRNPDYLTRLFRSRTGRSISDYIIDKRLQMVKQLLEKTDLSIVKISKKGGFPTAPAS